MATATEGLKKGLLTKRRHRKVAISYSCLRKAAAIEGRFPYHSSPTSSQLLVQASQVATIVLSCLTLCDLLPRLPHAQVTSEVGSEWQSLSVCTWSRC